MNKRKTPQLINENTPCHPIPKPLGSVEPHKNLLKIPHDKQLLYKIISVENLLRSIKDNYLHFNRVDSYIDFPDDGQQLPKDRDSNERMKFEKAPGFSAAGYCDQVRSRTYACCFSLENSDYIWNNHAKDNNKGKVCVVFEFEKLRSMINRFFLSGNAILEYNGNQYPQIFDVNYGIVKYVGRDKHRANTERINPIIYTYLKDRKDASEKELRISLSYFGPKKQFVSLMFTESLPLFFDFKSAIENKTIEQIEISQDGNFDFLKAELQKLGVGVSA